MTQPLSLAVDTTALHPLIADVVRQTLEQLEADRAMVNAGRFCYSEAEAAALLGLNQHQLRDERLRGRISFSRIVGRRIVYTPADLIAYLAARRVEADYRAAA